MTKDQIKLLSRLAKDLKARKKSKKEVVASLQAARILTKGNRFAGHYSHLSKAVSASE